MATPIPTYPTLTTVEAIRKLVNENFAKEINEDQVYDSRDIKRFNEVDDYALMFIQHGQYGNAFDEKKALKHFHEAMIWRKQNNVYDISPERFPADYVDRRVVFYKNHDVNNSPILHFLIRNFKKGQDDNEAVKRFETYYFEEQIRAHPGQRIVVFFDMSDTGLSHLDYDLVKYAISSFMTYYPGLLSYILVYKLPFILYAAWRLIKSWLPRETQNSVLFVDEKTITQYIPRDQIAEDIGGFGPTSS